MKVELKDGKKTYIFSIEEFTRDVEQKELTIEEKIYELENDIQKSKDAMENIKYEDIEIQNIHEEMLKIVIERNIKELKQLKSIIL